MTAELTAAPLSDRLAGIRHRERTEHDGPWIVQDITAAGGRLVTAALVVAICWFGASGTLVWRDQLLWTAGAIGAVVLGLSGVALYLLPGWRSVELARKEVVLLLSQPPWGPASMHLVTAETEMPRLVAGPGMARAHREACPLVAGKDLSEVVAGSMPLCGVCEP